MAPNTPKKPRESDAGPYAAPLPLDTPYAPWMKYAWAEDKKNIHEVRAASDPLVSHLRRTLQTQEKLNEVARNIDSMGASLFSKPDLASKLKLLDKPLRNPVPGLVGHFDRPEQLAANPQIAKYFEGLKTDPAFDGGKSRSIEAIRASEWQADVTSWCAAFVNWCLKQANVPYLNYATAKSWLGFGLGVAKPVYGCIVVIQPGKDTKSTTGHVAFYVRHIGDRIVLLGGNQSNWIKQSDWPETMVQKDGYRWPTTMDDYLKVAAESARLSKESARGHAAKIGQMIKDVLGESLSTPLPR